MFGPLQSQTNCLPCEPNEKFQMGRLLRTASAAEYGFNLSTSAFVVAARALAMCSRPGGRCAPSSGRAH